MIKINAIKFEVNTSAGLFGGEYYFTSGLNIVRGDNTSGKSSFFQAILYCLGLEELIGGKNEKTMQSVLKDVVEYPKGDFHNVLQSSIQLEVENDLEKIITLRRSVKNTSKSPKLIDVFEGPVLTSKNNIIEAKPMYIHDKGGASNEEYGFHLYLENFLNWKLPNVLSKLGESRKLYLQQVASSFIIEQKSGWSDFFATMPHYGLANKEARVIEFILDLDVYENQKKRQRVNADKRKIESNWETIYDQLLKLAEKGGGKLVGLEAKPTIINNPNSINILILYNDSFINISEYIDILETELESIEGKEIPSVLDKINENEKKLEELNEKVNQHTITYELISTEINFDKEKRGRYDTQLEFLNEELRKNQGALKVKKLGAEINLSVSNDSCPTCYQPIKPSLLPQDITENPMGIEENISFIEAQIKMLDVYVEGVDFKIDQKKKKQVILRKQLSELREEIRNIKKELISDDRLPSEIEIEKKINIRKKIEFYSKYLEDVTQLINKISDLSIEHKEVLAKFKNLPKDYLSHLDRKKIGKLTNEFRRILNKVNYTSKTTNNLYISEDTYLPIANETLENGEIKSYNIRFDSSASDFVRCIWAYTCGLYKVSKEFEGNHPRLLMFDEPKQQDIALEDFHKFLAELSAYEHGQILVFASFENSDKSFASATTGIKFNLNVIEGRLIKPIPN
ncbi:hypothetical protein AB9P05_21590 [Roseivirga sp. BDSF3-8]|uniref:hypothetical protein n=1 Tax=Roseivirga sp. BDSF3-8 TaxID=3241598 RepID=UPI003531F6F1